MTDIYFAKKDVHFTKTEKKLIDYIIASPQDFVRMSIGDVARCIGSSEPTVSRFARHCGYADFKELKNAVLMHISEENPPAGNSLPHWEVKLLPPRKDSFTGSSTVSKRRWNFWSRIKLTRAADMILAAETVWIYAKGASISMAELLRFRLNRIGRRVMLLPAGSSELFEHMNFFTEKDLVILFGFQKTPRRSCRDPGSSEKPSAIPAFSLQAGFTGRGGSGKCPVPVRLPAASLLNITPWLPRAALLDALVVMLGARLGESSAEHLDRLYKLKEHYKRRSPARISVLLSLYSAPFNSTDTLSPPSASISFNARFRIPADSTLNVRDSDILISYAPFVISPARSVHRTDRPFKFIPHTAVLEGLMRIASRDPAGGFNSRVSARIFSHVSSPVPCQVFPVHIEEEKFLQHLLRQFRNMSPFPVRVPRPRRSPDTLIQAPPVFQTAGSFPFPCEAPVSGSSQGCIPWDR